MSRINPEEARQGRKGKPVLRVLIAALVLCALAAIIMTVFGAMQPGDDLPAGRVGTGGAEAPAATAQPATPPAADSGTSAVTPGDAGTSPTPAPAN
ncbi:hypothetical protein Sa4125_34310 [Aureimonas sp. SA4125]|uniref:hypothetical protein n=1 Tax=Aureimonas sp. SA4125 TaxID=2826993 RepID=UPI001CC44596|nr:hypothetical protein [Aureimonas sp. SA4125]BDA85889.1 hypothetical protein Sa4125_34310 [Aureimonas sp. SA4125]